MIDKSDFLQALYAAPPLLKKLLMVAMDLVLIPFSVWLALSLRYGYWYTDMGKAGILYAALPFFTIPIFVRLGLYRAVMRYAGRKAYEQIFWGVIISSGILLAIMLMIGTEGLPRSLFAVYGVVAFTTISASRMFIRYLVQHSEERGGVPIAIYGAGGSGRQLAAMLSSAPEYKPVMFLDDDPRLQGREIERNRVYDPRAEDLERVLRRKRVEAIFLAVPSTSRRRRRTILRQLERLPYPVRSVPPLEEILLGHASIDQVRDVSIEDILGRDPVPPNEELLGRCVTNKNVMVTGAGGSIGSELCRQLIELEPHTMVLVERSEYALFKIESELRETIREQSLNLILIPLLGDVCDETRMDEIVETFRVDTIYHAAAYKHVPIVERNPIEGVRNNVMGTVVMADVALRHKVKDFVLISTDKAVRPANVMGASKRLAEMVLQARAQLPAGTTFSMVRFGNVLGSSGSVVPLFNEQIAKGGPVTVTHVDIKRYFMTVREAVQLVVQAGAMAEGGDVFVLDMGEPVRIYDLAVQMVHLSGLEVKDEANPDGDIEIRLTGLRPGEKLFEELLIGENALGTEHPKILRAREDFLAMQELDSVIEDLEAALSHYDLTKVNRILTRTVREYSGGVTRTSPSEGAEIIPIHAPSDHKR